MLLQFNTKATEYYLDHSSEQYLDMYRVFAATKCSAYCLYITANCVVGGMLNFAQFSKSKHKGFAQEEVTPCSTDERGKQGR